MQNYVFMLIQRIDFDGFNLSKLGLFRTPQYK
jgi:hypothetical protein